MSMFQPIRDDTDSYDGIVFYLLLSGGIISVWFVFEKTINAVAKEIVDMPFLSVAPTIIMPEVLSGYYI